MDEKYVDRRIVKNAELRIKIDNLLGEGELFLKESLKDLNIVDYRYEIDEAVAELSLDEDIIYQLIEDYIIQVLKSKILFYQYIDNLKKDEYNSRILNYENIRDLAHKNLGVARNLRIKDAQKILEILMKEDDLERISLYVKALEITAIKLNPLCAYETLNLIKVKNSL